MDRTGAMKGGGGKVDREGGMSSGGEQNDALIVSLLFHPACRNEEERKEHKLKSAAGISLPIQWELSYLQGFGEG